MIKYSDASNVEKIASAVISSSMPKKQCCVLFSNEMNEGPGVCDKCGNHLYKHQTSD